MTRILIPVILIIVALGLFFSFTDPRYQEYQAIQKEIAQYDDALLKARELQELRDRLVSVYNTFSTSDLEKLQKMLPENVDNVRLIIEMEAIASSSNMILGGIQVAEASVSAAGAADPSQNSNPNRFESVILNLSVSGEYEDFLVFIKELERSLRIVDIMGLSFRAGSTPDTTYLLSLETYWLPNN